MARVLVVEDESALRLLYRIALKNNRYEVIAVESGNEALKVLEREQIDAVVSDLRLPDISGLRLIDEIQSQHPFLPIIINTAYDFIGENSYGWRVAESVSKSSGTAGLMRALARVISAEAEIPSRDSASSFHEWVL